MFNSLLRLFIGLSGCIFLKSIMAKRMKFIYEKERSYGKQIVCKCSFEPIELATPIWIQY